MNKATSYRSCKPGERGCEPALENLAFAATCLLEMPIGRAIAEILARLGRTNDACRCWMIDYDDDLTRFRNSHEWCAKSVTSHIDDLQDTPVAMIGWLHRSLLAGKAVMIDDVAALPDSARTLRREMLRQGDKSVLSVPVFHAGRLRAIIGFDTVRTHRVWTDAEASLLDLCGRIIAAARYGETASGGMAVRPVTNLPLVYLREGGGKIRGVPFRNIVALRSHRNETYIWLDDGSVANDRRPLNAWRALLPLANFPTIHRTAIVNIAHLAGLDKHGGAGFHWQVHIRGVDEPWPVARQYRNALVERMGW